MEGDLTKAIFGEALGPKHTWSVSKSEVEAEWRPALSSGDMTCAVQVTLNLPGTHEKVIGNW